MTLEDDLVAELRKRGSTPALDVDSAEQAAEWRAAARAAGRTLGRPVETYGKEIADGAYLVSAWLTDWPANELEEQVTEARMRRVVNQMPSRTLDLSGLTIPTSPASAS